MNLKVMKMIAAILHSDRKASVPSGTHPSASLRLVMAVFCILLCALSHNAWFTLAVAAVELLRVSLKPAKEITGILRPVLFAVLMAAVFTLPAVFMGSPQSFGTIVLKTAASVLVLSLMNAEVPWKDTTHALQFLHLPAAFTAVLDSTVRFLVILGRFTDQMLEAVSLRRTGKKKWKNAGTGGILGTAFLKSRKMSLETYEAMVCRGFDGNYRAACLQEKTDREQIVVNLLYCLLFPVLLLGFFYTEALL